VSDTPSGAVQFVEIVGSDHAHVRALRELDEIAWRALSVCVIPPEMLAAKPCSADALRIVYADIRTIDRAESAGG
jgi:hypothetical protein